MRPQRLSYQAAGTALAPRVETAAATRGASLALGPPLAGRAPRYGGTAQSRQRRIVVATLLAVHALGVVGLLDASRLRDVAVDAKPIFLAVVDAPVPVAPPRPLPPPPTAKMPPPPPLTLPLIAPETPLPAPSPLPAQAQVPPPPPAAAAPVETPPAPAPSLPRTIPPSAVQYITPPAPVYSRVSAKMRESGKAVIRVWIDEAGLPRNVQLATSTGFARLDDSALAAVRNCRFKPYLENGNAVAGWALIPIEFELPA